MKGDRHIFADPSDAIIHYVLDVLGNLFWELLFVIGSLAGLTLVLNGAGLENVWVDLRVVGAVGMLLL